MMDRTRVSLQKGETCTVFVTDISFSAERELTIWVQIGPSTESILSDISLQLDEESQCAQQLVDIRIGALCACKFVEDQQWYRASIVRKTQNGKWVARFIDYGNCQVFNESEFFELPMKMDEIPPLASALTLDGSLQPVESANLWTSLSSDILLNCLLYTEIEVTISNVVGDKVEIFCPTINDMLVSSGVAVFEKREYPYSDFMIGHKFEAYVSSASPNGNLVIQDIGSSLLLDQMMDLMAEYYAKSENQVKAKPSDIAPGSLVVAVYSCDKNYYRVQVVNTDEYEKCTVYFIDYGNEEVQDITSLYQLAPKFCHLSYQAIECKLHNIVISTEKFSRDLQDFLINKTTGESISCEIVEHVRTGSTKFSITAKCKDEKLSTCLIAKGFAKRKHDVKPLDFQYVEVDIGSQYEVCVSHIESNGIFYVSLMKDAAKLDKLMDELSDYCPNAQSLPQISAEMSCCSLYDQDHNWYRAKIKSFANNSCEVMYVDYGNCATCPLSSLCSISKEFMTLRCQAIECSIPRQLSSDEIELLESLYGKMVEVKFLRRTDSVNSYHVKVVQEGKVLFPPLVKKELAITDFEPQKIKLDLIDKVKVLRILSPDDVWGRLVSNETALQRLCTELNEIYNNDKSGNLKTIAVGSLCVVNDTDFNQWCRGKVVSVMSNQSYSVMLVDVGILKNYSLNKIHQISSSQLLKVPCQAFNFKMVHPLLYEIHKAHPTMFLSYFLDNTFKCKFLSLNKVNNSYSVELFDDKGIPVEQSLSKALFKSSDSLAGGDGSHNGYDHITKMQSGISVPLNESFVDVAVCFVEDPDCIWLQLQSNAKVLFKLLDDLQIFYSELPSNVLSFHQPQYDALCAVKVKNQATENWYRGRILCVYADVIEVQLIDFGSEVKVKQKDIKMLSTRFSQPDPQAIKCKLFNLLPIRKQWTNKAVQDLSNILKEQPTSVSAKFIDRHRSSYIVDFQVVLNTKLVNVSGYMVKHVHAVWQDLNQVTREAALTLEESDLSNSAYGNDGSPKISKPKIFYQSPGVAFVGAELEVISSEVTSPDDFFLQINDACHRQKYASLMQDLNTAYASGTVPNISEEEFYVGLPCAVYYDRVKQWCRGAILDYKELEDMQICLVDYGCMISCPMNKVKTLDIKFVVKAPPEAMRCTLQGIVNPKCGSWSSEAINLCVDFFESDRRNLTCTIHACAGSEFCSYFICSVRTPLRNLADELVSTGLGVKASIMGKVNPPLKLKSFIYSNLGEVKGKEDIFYVTHVDAPNLFYCQLTKQFNQLDDMMDDLELHCESNKISVAIEDLVQDCMCFAKYYDKWNRAHIVSPVYDGQMKVLFVDYGNTEHVQLSDVQKFANDKFYELPIQALPCSFKDIDTAAMPSKEQLATLELMRSELMEKEFDGVVIGSTNGKLHLDLFNDGKRVNDIFVKKCDAGQSSSASIDNTVELYDASLPTSVNLVEPFFLQNDLVQTVTLANCVDPHNFYVWFNKLDDERENCMVTIDGLYTAMRNSDYKLQVIQPGDIICARRSKDMKWCRAKVLSVDEKDVEVFYVDTGENDCVLRAYDVKQLIIKMGKWPKMAVPCTLANIKPAIGNRWSPQAEQEFQVLAKNCKLTARFLQEHNGRWSVELSKEDMDLAKHLVDIGLATNKEESYNGASALSKEGPKIELPLFWEDEKQVFISHVVSEKEIYIQSLDAFDEMDNLKTLICDDKNLQQLSSEPILHSFCLARYDVDNQLYRAQILAAKSNAADDCEVRFVDFGNIATVKTKNMFLLNSKYASVPQSAVSCKIISLPGNVSTKEMIAKLEALSQSGDVAVFASFVKKDFDDHNVVKLRILQDEDIFVPLDVYLACDGNKASDTTSSFLVADTPQLQYSVIQNILNQASRSIYISHVENPGHVYCQLSEFCNELDRLMDSIESYYSEDRLDDHVTSLPVGSACVAKYTVDNAWYRALVEEIVDADHLKVQFIDYGNSDTLALTNIRKSKIGFCTLPKQAIHCHVAMVDHNSAAWTETEINDFDSRVATLQLKATFSRIVSENESIFEVMLRLPDETLLNKEYMKSKSSLLENDNIVGPDVLNDQKSETFKTNDIVNDGNTSELPEQVFLKEVSLSCGEKKNCYISYAESVSNFHVQIAGTENDLDSLYGLCAKDSQAYQHINSDEETFPIKRYCVAKSPDDGEWYRGQITKHDNKPTVFFVDYGNFSTVEWMSVKPISRDSSVLPIQAISCSLSGLGTLTPEVHEVAVDNFFDLVESALVNVQFLRKVDNSWEVCLKVNGVHIAEKILYEIETKFPDFTPALKIPPTLPPVTEESTENAVSKASEMVYPGAILRGRIVFVTDLTSFYVKLETALGACSTSSISMPCIVKHNAEDTWENAIAIKIDDSNELVVMTNGMACLSNELFEVKKSEGESDSPLSVFHCTLENCSAFSSPENVSEKFAKEILNKDILVAFTAYDQSSSKWEVRTFLSDGQVVQLLQASDRPPLLHLDSIEDTLRYNAGVFKQLKDMITDNENSVRTLQLIETAIQNLETNITSVIKWRSQEAKQTFAADYKKRHFSSFMPTPSPCKKPRLDNLPVAYHGTPVIFEAIPEQDERVNNVSPGDFHKSSMFSIDSPYCFYVKPDVFPDHKLPEIPFEKLSQLENVESNVLCAFISEDTMKRGFVLDVNADEAVLLDIDSGFKYVLALSNIFSYPQEWIKYEPLVVLCSLYDVVPKDDDWSPEACTLFHELVESESDVFVEFVDKCKCDKPLQKWYVSVVIGERSVSNTLVEKNLANTNLENNNKLPKKLVKEVDMCSKYINQDQSEAFQSVDESQEVAFIDQTHNNEFQKIHEDDVKVDFIRNQNTEKDPTSEQSEILRLNATVVEEENTKKIMQEPQYSESVLKEIDETPIANDSARLNSPTYSLQKVTRYRIKLVESSSLSHMSDSVFIPDESKDSFQGTGDGVFAVQSFGARSNDRLPGFVMPLAMVANEKIPDLETEKTDVVTDDANVLDESTPDKLKAVHSQERCGEVDVEVGDNFQASSIPDKLDTTSRQDFDNAVFELSVEQSPISKTDLKEQRLPGFISFGSSVPPVQDEVVLDKSPAANLPDQCEVLLQDFDLQSGLEVERNIVSEGPIVAACVDNDIIEGTPKVHSVVAPEDADVDLTVAAQTIFAAERHECSNIPLLQSEDSVYKEADIAGIETSEQASICNPVNDIRESDQILDKSNDSRAEFHDSPITEATIEKPVSDYCTFKLDEVPESTLHALQTNESSRLVKIEESGTLVETTPSTEKELELVEKIFESNAKVSLIESSRYDEIPVEKDEDKSKLSSEIECTSVETVPVDEASSNVELREKEEAKCKLSTEMEFTLAEAVLVEEASPNVETRKEEVDNKCKSSSDMQLTSVETGLFEKEARQNVETQEEEVGDMRKMDLRRGETVLVDKEVESSFQLMESSSQDVQTQESVSLSEPVEVTLDVSSDLFDLEDESIGGLKTADLTDKDGVEQACGENFDTEGNFADQADVEKDNDTNQHSGNEEIIAKTLEKMIAADLSENYASLYSETMRNANFNNNTVVPLQEEQFPTTEVLLHDEFVPVASLVVETQISSSSTLRDASQEKLIEVGNKCEKLISAEDILVPEKPLNESGDVGEAVGQPDALCRDELSLECSLKNEVSFSASDSAHMPISSDSNLMQLDVSQLSMGTPLETDINESVDDRHLHIDPQPSETESNKDASESDSQIDAAVLDSEPTFDESDSFYDPCAPEVFDLGITSRSDNNAADLSEDLKYSTAPQKHDDDEMKEDKLDNEDDGTNETELVEYEDFFDAQ